MPPVVEADLTIPWLSSRAAVVRVARHLGCTPEAAELQIKANADRIAARGVIDGRWVLMPAPWSGTIDLTGTAVRPPGASYEITNVELCRIDLIAAGLLPVPPEKARWSAAEAIAFLLKGIPLPWGAWQGAGASPAEIAQAEVDLGALIRAGLPAWGWHPLKGKRKRIPADHFRDEMIEHKALPVALAHRPRVIVRIDGTVGTSPPQRSADYRGLPWSAIEVDSAALRLARPRPLTVRAEPAPAEGDEAKQRGDGYQAKRVRPVLRQLYPDGVPGRDVIGTSALRQRVIKELELETRQKGLRAPSWQTVDRVRDDC
jgi:hypothetical protein